VSLVEVSAEEPSLTEPHRGHFHRGHFHRGHFHRGNARCEPGPSWDHLTPFAARLAAPDLLVGAPFAEAATCAGIVVVAANSGLNTENVAVYLSRFATCRVRS
jgi:hypothetical protein